MPTERVRYLSIILALTLIGCGTAAPSASSTAPAPPPVASAPAAAATPTAATPTASGLPVFADMPFYRNDVRGRLVQPGPGPVAKPERAWRVDIGATHWAPILVGGLIVVGTTAGEVIALDGRTGARRWAFQAAHPFTTGSFNGSAAASGGLVFVSDTSTTYALDATTGVQRWAAQTTTKGSRPLVVDGVVYVGTVGGALGLAEATGAEVWRWTGPRNVATTMGPVVDGVAFLSSRSDGRLYAIDIHDGSEHWHLQTIAVAVGSAEVVGDTVYVGTNQAGASEPVGQIYAVDRATGRPRWQFGGPHGGQIIPGPVRDGILYVSGEADGIYALRDDGSVAWGPIAAPPSVLPMSMVGSTLYEQRADGSIGAYDSVGGTLLWETPATGEDHAGGPPLVDGGMVFEVGDAHGVTAYADPALIAALPTAAVEPAPSPTQSAGQAADPFTVVRSIPWAATKLAIPLGMDAGPDGNLYILDTKPSVTVIDPQDGRIVRTWGRQGTGPGEFDVTVRDDNPGVGDLAVAPDGRVYVADGSNHRVQVFRPDGSFIAQFGGFGDGDGQFGSVSEIVAGLDGSLFVMDGSSYRISKFSPDGKFRWRSPTPDAEPDLANYVHGMAVRADGTVLAACEGCDRLIVFDPASGQVRGRIPAPGTDGLAGSLSLDPAGNIYTSTYETESTLVLSPIGVLIGERVLGDGMQRMEVNKQATWGDVFWPAPIFLPDGRAFAFWKHGLVELRVTLRAA